MGIREILGRHVADLQEGNKKLDFILKKLHVPAASIHQAKALKSRNEHRYFEEVESLLAASAWNEAHKTITLHVAPVCVINDDLSRLHDILSKFVDASVVENWSVGGQVYLDFINL